MAVIRKLKGENSNDQFGLIGTYILQLQQQVCHMK